MTTNPEISRNALHIRAGIYGALAIACFALGVVGFVYANFELTLITTIPAMIFGHHAFNNLESAAQPSPPPISLSEVETFVSRLKTGSELEIIIEITVESLQPTPDLLGRIRVDTLRRLNESLIKRYDLDPDPFQTIDEIIQKYIPSLCADLKLGKLFLRTIEVNGGKTTQPRSQGIYFGERRQ